MDEPDALRAITVQVIYMAPSEAIPLSLRLPDGATLEEAIRASGLIERHGLNQLEGLTGIFGQLQPLNRTLRDGDRVEIYRPLPADPKDRRRKRARRPPVADAR